MLGASASRPSRSKVSRKLVQEVNLSEWRFGVRTKSRNMA